jgi:hypothetical protein
MKQPPLSGKSGGGGDGEDQCISSSKDYQSDLCEMKTTMNESLAVGADKATVQSSREGLYSGGRRLRRRSISSPEFCMLVAPDPLVGGGSNLPLDCIRRPSTGRRSLSPERSSSLGAYNFPHQTALHLDGLINSDHSNGGVRSGRRSSSSSVPRRQTMPEQIHDLINLGDVMDSNALRYLPKILRDVYAQRQSKRPSMVSSSLFRRLIFSFKRKSRLVSMDQHSDMKNVYFSSFHSLGKQYWHLSIYV